ncbi:hypothetical protein DPV78_001432 [Talaromyces pinophilus]|nr:hypothetical protein DPV78_001432 [Talaromyces pinophilus]
MFVTMATSSINTPTHSAGEANNSPVIPQDSLSSAIDSNEVGTDKVNNEQDKKVEVDSSPPPTTERGAQFWAIIATLCVIGLLSALENTVVTTSLSYIVTELSLGENYVWVTNVFFLTSAAVQPLFGQLANIFGRRWVTMAIVAFFTLGSGIAGGASNGAMLIAGRAIQGVGSGGINMIVDVIVSDLVPLRERGNYMAFVVIVYFVGMAVGPYVGGAFVDHTTWRWVFWINLPVGGISMVMILLFLRVKSKKTPLSEKISRIDYIGNFLLIASTVHRFAMVILAGYLSFGNWATRTGSLHVLRDAENGQRTSRAAESLQQPHIIHCLRGNIHECRAAILDPLLSTIVGVPGAAVAVLLLTKFGRYKPLHLLGFGIFTLGVGLFVLFDRKTPLAQVVVFEMIAAGGSGFVLNTLLPACQAPLEEKDQAAITAAWSFMRSFGSIWGVAIPSAIFNNRFSQLLGRIQDPQVTAMFINGAAYQHATTAFLNSFSEPTKDQLIGVYTESLKRVWEIAIVFSGVAFLLVFIEKEIKLRTELDTDFGLETENTADVETVEEKTSEVD